MRAAKVAAAPVATAGIVSKGVAEDISNIKLHFSLCSQDLPEFFEDNIKAWMGHFHTLLEIARREPQRKTRKCKAHRESVLRKACRKSACQHGLPRRCRPAGGMRVAEARRVPGFSAPPRTPESPAVPGL